MATAWIVPAGTDSAPGARDGDYLLRPTGSGSGTSELYEVGTVSGACTWVGTVDAGLLPALPAVTEPQEAPDQERVLTAARGVVTAEHSRGG